MTSSPAIPTSRPIAANGSRSSGNSRWIRLSMSLSTPSIMRLPEIVLTTLYEALLDGFLLQLCMIAGMNKMRYEVLYDCRCRLKDPDRGLPPLVHRLLVLGVDVLDVLPDEALGVLEVLATLAENIGRMEGRHRLDAAVEVVPLAAVLGDPEVLVYDGLGGGATGAEDDLRPYRLHLSLEVDVAGPDLTRPRLAVLHASPLLDRCPALDDVREVDVLTSKTNCRKDVVEQLAGPPDERQPGGVLVLARPLADEHQRRIGIAGPEDRVRPAESQVAPGADRDLTGQLFESFLPALAAFRGVKESIHSSPPWSYSNVLHCAILPPYRRRYGAPPERANVHDEHHRVPRDQQVLRGLPCRRPGRLHGRGRIIEVGTPEHFFQNLQNERTKRFLNQMLHM